MALDLDYTVPDLMNGIFGTAKWMAAKARRTTSAAAAGAKWSEERSAEEMG